MDYQIIEPLALYKKMGFEVEGIRKRDLKYGEGKYVDTVVMGRFRGLDNRFSRHSRKFLYGVD